jgi:hypothetical protein
MCVYCHIIVVIYSVLKCPNIAIKKNAQPNDVEEQ